MWSVQKHCSKDFTDSLKHIFYIKKIVTMIISINFYTFFTLCKIQKQEWSLKKVAMVR